MGRLDWAAQQEAAAGRQAPERLSLDQRMGSANGHHPSVGEGGAPNRGPRHRCRAAVCHGRGVLLCAARPQEAGMSRTSCRKNVPAVRRCTSSIPGQMQVTALLCHSRAQVLLCALLSLAKGGNLARMNLLVMRTDAAGNLPGCLLERACLAMQAGGCCS